MRTPRRYPPITWGQLKAEIETFQGVSDASVVKYHNISLIVPHRERPAEEAMAQFRDPDDDEYWGEVVDKPNCKSFLISEAEAKDVSARLASRRAKADAQTR